MVAPAEDFDSPVFGEDDEDSFFREIQTIGRGRPRTRDEVSLDSRTRLSRWDESQNESTPPSFSQFKTLPPGLTEEQIAALLLRLRIDEITKKVTFGPIEITDRDRERSPSPPPVYDNNGKRSNTREQRVKDKLQKERHGLIQIAQQVNPSYKPPSDYTPPHEKKTCKIYIPIKDHPEYNFIGLIIGPRGNTQKKLEKESGAKIAIRGKGSSRDGKATKVQYQENDELHVLLTADTQEQLDKASILVREFLVPVEEGKNEHKRQQLRELAEMNGTLRERPAYMGGKNWAPVDIKCVHCNEVSHPSSDCPLRNNESNIALIEAEFKKFIEEVNQVLGFDVQTYEDPNGNSHDNSTNNSPPNMNQQYNSNNNLEDDYDYGYQQQQPPHNSYEQQGQWNNNGYNNNYNNQNNYYDRKQQPQQQSPPPPSPYGPTQTHSSYGPPMYK
ncbi:hypothetical protein CYY_001827 [Polysphondylium violaceum]|uniref:Branchpoint-bridging protein n=1 Tax=Polysphondylium violaceum TaxID=133409 RepID=A0A8J4V198_9MYCE|nr:hypothetical protein CYY_001827 [Polysphondylium violaceum]